MNPKQKATHLIRTYGREGAEDMAARCLNLCRTGTDLRQYWESVTRELKALLTVPQ